MLFLFITQLWAAPKCYTLQDLKDAQCKVLCIRDGHTGGKWVKKVCVCESAQDEDYLANVLRVISSPNDN